MNHNKSLDNRLNEQNDIAKKSEPIINEPQHAVVANCQRLNVRRESNTNSDIVCVLNVGDEILVECVSDDWAHVYTSAGIEGHVICSCISITSDE